MSVVQNLKPKGAQFVCRLTLTATSTDACECVLRAHSDSSWGLVECGSSIVCALSGSACGLAPTDKCWVAMPELSSLCDRSWNLQRTAANAEHASAVLSLRR